MRLWGCLLGWEVPLPTLPKVVVVVVVIVVVVIVIVVVVVVVVVFVAVVAVVAFSRVAPPQDRDCIDPCGVRLKFFDGGNRE